MQPEIRLDIATPPSASPLSFAISPDGRSVAYVATVESGSRPWIRSIDSATARLLPGTDDAYPFWSPDGLSLGFFAEGRLKRIDVDGGAPRILAPVLNAYGGAWDQNGTILFVHSRCPCFPRVGGPTHTFYRQQYDSTQNGQRFLMNALAAHDTTPPLTVVLNWKPRP